MSAPHSDSVDDDRLIATQADLAAAVSVAEAGRQAIAANVAEQEGRLANVSGGAGPTAQRPTFPVAGTFYFDATIGRPIWWDGGKWINASGGTV